LEVEEVEEQDTTITGLGNDSFSEANVDNVRAETQDMVLLPEAEDRRATFTFLFNEDENVPYPEARDDPSASTTGFAPADHMDHDATITRLFQASHEVSFEDITPPKSPSYPELPSMPPSEADTAVAIDQDYIVEGVVERNVDDDSNLAQPADDAMNEDTAADAEPSTEYVAIEDSDAVIEGVAYPMLPQDSSVEESVELMDEFLGSETAAQLSAQRVEDDSADFDSNSQDEDSDENFTEVSLQLSIQREMQMGAPDSSDSNRPISENAAPENAEGTAGQDESTIKASSAVGDSMDDITSGLTLGPLTSSREPTPRRLRSPSPPPRTASGPEDATMTFAFDDDTALLKDFLSRAAASKANKAENIARRESLQNRRDSDVIRHALASPRKALEDKDPNSPSKYDTETTLNLSQTLTLDMDSAAPLSPSKASTQAEAKAEGVDDSKAARISRRSSRARTSRLPGPSSIPTGPPKISVKRDGGDPVILKKTDAQVRISMAL
jgi:hypothetical protein